MSDEQYVRDGQAPKLEIPPSGHLSKETVDCAEQHNKYFASIFAAMTGLFKVNLGEVAKALPIREKILETFYTSPYYTDMTDRYGDEVQLMMQEIGGVPVEIFTPVGGVAEENRNRVLINLHGGGFIHGERSNSRLESYPIAATGKMKVISVDYRQGPEYQFPAAMDDVIAVYEELLKEYKAENIGVYGASAGAWLTGQTVARILSEDLPRPGAIGIFQGGPVEFCHGDSLYITSAIQGPYYVQMPVKPMQESFSYFKNVTVRTPLVLPGEFPEVLAKFPPALFITSTRDMCMSHTLTTHSRLAKAGVETRLHVWEGLYHYFHVNPKLQESQDAYQIIAGFFDKQLGRSK